MDTWHYIVPFIGGLALEVVYWFQLKEKLHLAKYRRMLSNPVYWAIVVAMAVIGGIVGISWGLSEDEAPTLIELLFIGAATPSLLKNVGAATTAGQATKLGPADDQSDDASFGLRDYFSP